MASQIEADVDVQSFGFASDADGKRLLFPHAHSKQVEGRAGKTGYGAAECSFEALEGRLDTVRWEAGSASIGGAWLKDDAGRYALAVDRIEMPHGVRLVRADHGVEVLSPHVSFSELRLEVKGPFGAPR